MRTKASAFLSLLLVLILVLTGCAGPAESPPQPVTTSQTVQAVPSPAPATATKPATQPAAATPATQSSLQQPAQASGTLKVHFLDVGQADSILVQFPSCQNLLIDGGNNDDGAAVVSYLRQQGVERLDHVVGTRPHEDHIGGLGVVLRSFPVGKVYLPRATTTTSTFEDLLLAIKEKGLKVTQAQAGVKLDVAGAEAVMLAPNAASYEDLNNYSAVLKVTFGSTSFLFTGDAEAESESQMLAKGYNLKSDVLKVGHHGSASSTTPAFLRAVAPKYAVISVSKDNPYGHPSPDTLAKLASAGVQVYRTDLQGTIVATSDGKKVTFNKDASPVKERAPNLAAAAAGASVPSQVGYIGNKNTKKFHQLTCRSLPAPQNRVYFSTRDEAVKAGYVACKICNP